mmetsp:Transcript_3337/g.5194  ORF Transcript_3337/g.5194 Transcript_3337/m.5194 type:complete len:83 (+) Transcript_3337:1571-1819(+)
MNSTCSSIKIYEVNIPPTGTSTTSVKLIYQHFFIENLRYMHLMGLSAVIPTNIVRQYTSNIARAATVNVELHVSFPSYSDVT